MIRLPEINPLADASFVSLTTKGMAQGKRIEHVLKLRKGYWDLEYKWSLQVPFNPSYVDGVPTFSRGNWILRAVLDQILKHDRVPEGLKRRKVPSEEWPAGRDDVGCPDGIELFNRLDTGLNTDNYSVYGSMPGATTVPIGQMPQSKP